MLTQPAMKIKTACLILSLLAGSYTGMAQLRLALYGGIHSANVIEKNSLPGWDTTTKPFYSARTGFQIGFLAEIPIGRKGFYFQPGIVLITTGRQYSKYNDSATAALTDTIYEQSALNLSYMEVPLYLTYKIPLSANHKNQFFISAGPYFSFFFSGTTNLQTRILSSNQFSEENTDLNPGKAVDKYKTMDMGISAKAGFELGNVMISGYFSQGLTNFYTAPYDGTFHHKLVGATLGIWLNKAVPPASAAAKDSDFDGVPDTEDACPMQAGLARWKGCPIPDTDHDGINDEEDSCRDIAGVAKYHGCPVPDTDGDGIDNEHDSCITVAGTLKYHGCPIPDRDHDGLNDEDDRCPDTPGSKDNNGCPVIAKPIEEKLVYLGDNVKFKSASTQLTQKSSTALNKLVALMQSHPAANLTIEGYTDATGPDKFNLSLSQQRAESVKSYLVKKGIAENRIRAIGFGSQKPAADNKTIKGKSLNRRVEFKF
jgi:OOP family OmpA-OmpF porin